MGPVRPVHAFQDPKKTFRSLSDLSFSQQRFRRLDIGARRRVADNVENATAFIVRHCGTEADCSWTPLELKM